MNKPNTSKSVERNEVPLAGFIRAGGLTRWRKRAAVPHSASTGSVVGEVSWLVIGIGETTGKVSDPSMRDSRASPLTVERQIERPVRG